MTKILEECKKAVEKEIREDCREEAMKILELGDKKDRMDFLKYHRKLDKGNLCCLVLDFAKKKLVEAGKMEQKETDCFKDPYIWLNENSEKSK
jgi:predicted acetyltransferase